jgi:transcription antitermination factor NusG
MTALAAHSPFVKIATVEPLPYHEPRVWHALVTRPNREQEAADWLRRGRVHAYWPCYTRQVNAGRGLRNGRAQTVARFSAVIPGYLFVAARTGPGNDPWDIIHQTPGIMGYVRDAYGDAATLTNEDIEVIRRIEGQLNLPPPKSHAHKFKVGSKVRFSDDLMGRWPVGRVTGLAETGQISVETNLLGRAVTIWVGPHQIVAV